MKIRNFLFAAALASSLPVAPPAHAQTGATNNPFWTGMRDAAAFEHATEARLGHARTRLGAVLAVKGARSIENTLQPYLVSDFLGRPFEFKAWENWLNQE